MSLKYLQTLQWLGIVHEFTGNGFVIQFDNVFYCSDYAVHDKNSLLGVSNSILIFLNVLLLFIDYVKILKYE